MRRVAVLSFLGTSCLISLAAADCPAWDRPRIEETEITKRLNYHSEGSRVCITRSTAYCDYCVPGFFHDCRKNVWEVLRGYPCKGDEDEKLRSDPKKGGLKKSKTEKTDDKAKSGPRTEDQDCLRMKDPDLSRHLQEQDPEKWLQLNEKCS